MIACTGQQVLVELAVVRTALMEGPVLKRLEQRLTVVVLFVASSKMLTEESGYAILWRVIEVQLFGIVQWIKPGSTEAFP